MLTFNVVVTTESKWSDMRKIEVRLLSQLETNTALFLSVNCSSELLCCGMVIRALTILVFSDRLRSETVIIRLKLYCGSFQTDTSVFIPKLFAV